MVSSESSFCFELRSFFEEVLPHRVFDGYDDTIGRIVVSYIVRGVVMDETYRHSRRIRIVEDLAGNFPETSGTIMVWGGAGINETSIFQQSWFSPPIEILTCSYCYKTGETLIMILWGFEDIWKSPYFQPIIEEEYAEVLTPNHFHLNPQAPVLRLRNSYVTGYISREIVAGQYVWTNRMSWRDFQRELNNVLKKTKKNENKSINNSYISHPVFWNGKRAIHNINTKNDIVGQ